MDWHNCNTAFCRYLHGFGLRLLRKNVSKADGLSVVHKPIAFILESVHFKTQPRFHFAKLLY